MKAIEFRSKIFRELTFKEIDALKYKKVISYEKLTSQKKETSTYYITDTYQLIAEGVRIYKYEGFFLLESTTSLQPYLINLN